MQEIIAGSPMPAASTVPQQIITEVGDYDNADGCRVLLLGNNLVFLASISGNEMTLGIDIWQVLDAIQAYTRRHES